MISEKNSGAQHFVSPGSTSQLLESPDVESKIHEKRDFSKQQSLLRSILSALDKPIPPVRRTFAYRVGVLLAAGAMVLLPIIYIGLIIAICFFLYWHATTNGKLLFPGRGGIWGWLFLYLAPLISGTLMVLFMIKPLFTRSASESRCRRLENGREPLVFALVKCVAKAVHAPEPRHIEVNFEANASASLGDGLWGFFGRSLTLRIGLPLAGAMTVQELAGILAHELGHFRQGLGMRMTYMVRSINIWFARAVFERDEWDDTLASWSEDVDFRIGVFLYLARFFIFLTRCVLWLFMALGHGLSCFLMRHMEYDADRCEARLVGSQAWEKTYKEVIRLDVAVDLAHKKVFHHMFQDRYPNDLIALTASLANEISGKAMTRLKKKLEKLRTGWFDTHPSFSDRRANVERECREGILRVSQPASDLFSNFGKLSRQVTLNYYKATIGRVKKDQLYPFQEERTA